jgi:DNA-binding GntR family transcriptional regulator
MSAGEYAPGDRLPSNRALTGRYGVASETIRAALDDLRGEGLIASQSTRGTYVVRKPAAAGGPSPEFMQIMQRLDEMEAQVRRQNERIDELEQQRQRGQ